MFNFWTEERIIEIVEENKWIVYEEGKMVFVCNYARFANYAINKNELLKCSILQTELNDWKAGNILDYISKMSKMPKANKKITKRNKVIKKEIEQMMADNDTFTKLSLMTSEELTEFYKRSLEVTDNLQEFEKRIFEKI